MNGYALSCENNINVYLHLFHLLYLLSTNDTSDISERGFLHFKQV